MILSVVGICITTLILPEYVFAAKKRVRVVSKGAISFSSAKLSRSTNSIIVNFTNLPSTTKISYELTYDANGVSQGVTGTIVPNGANSESRDLYFGTCSKGVCTPHTNITNAELLIQVTRKNNTMTTKLYRVRI
jgi:hypothetical protein